MSEIVMVPGLLVNLNSSVRGNTSYYKDQLENPHLVAGGEERSKWETTKIVIDPDEQKAAEKVRDKCRSLIRSVCSSSSKFGLLCPNERKDELIERVAEARVLAADFNREAVYTHVDVNIFWGVVAQDDVQAAQAVVDTVTDLMAKMQTGLAELDAKKVRAICDETVQLKQILTPDARSTTDIAIRTARSACNRIVAAGEAVVKEIDRNAIRTIGMARTSFLDIDYDDDIVVTAPAGNGRALEMEAI